MRRFPALLAALLLSASPALADGDGPDRALTPSEATAFAALVRAVREALPPAPANYTLAFSDGTGPGGPRVPAAIKPDQMARLRFTATYALNQGYGDAQLQGSLMDRAKGTPDQQARLAALTAKNEELTRRRDAARDRAEKDRIRAELKAVRGEEDRLNDEIMAGYQAWVASGGAAAAMQGAAQSLPAKEFTIKALVNQDVSLSEKAAPYAPAGVALAFEQTEGCELSGDCCFSVLLGPFDKDKQKRGTHWLYKLRGTNLGVPTKPRGIVLVVSGPKRQAQTVRELLAGTDLAALEKLLP